jgi:hypothetical protein
VGFAIQMNLGRLDDGAILLLTLGIVLAVVGSARPNWRAITARNVRIALGAALVVQFVLLFFWPPSTAPALQLDANLLPFRIGLVAALLLALFELTDVQPLHRTRLVALFAFWTMAALWVIAITPVPGNDVWWFQQIGSQALLNGTDPYSVQMPNIFGPRSPYYAPETMVGDHLTFGLPYPPLSLLLTLPGYFLFGDVRYALLAAVVLAAALIATLRPGPLARGAALLFLFTPRSFFILAQSWTEPILVLLLVVVVTLSLRRHLLALVPIALGSLLAVKQHLALVLPIAVLLVPPPRTWKRLARGAGVAIGLAAAITLPFLVWDPAGFWRSLVALQVQQPFRSDALSYLAWLRLDNPANSSVLGFFGIIPPAVLAVSRAARTPAGFAGTVGVVYLFFFAFNKQAFANYYYFVIGALCCAVAATSPPGPIDERA